MKTLYIECNMGAAGDMLMSALLELHPNPEEFIKNMNSLKIPNVEIKLEKSVKCGITGTHIRVISYGIEENENMYEHHHEHNHEHNHEHSHEHNHEHNHKHHHTKVSDIENIISNLDVSENVKKNAVKVYKLIAEAESNAHGKEIEDIHFHEVGTMDAVADVVGCCMLIEYLNADEIIVSPIRVGFGSVKCAHGVLSVPAPATAYILKDVPVYAGDEAGEMCTPTGAAVLKHFADKFENMPVMKIQKIGYGMGTKDFKTANYLRVFLGESSDKTDSISELKCNIDDMTGEEIAFAFNKIFEAGALDVFTTAIGMKKNRPAVLLSCICREDNKNEIIKTIFKYTSTIGIRENISKRYILERTEKTLYTEYGDVRAKECRGYGVKKLKAEYDDVFEIADKNNISISDIKFI